MAATILETRQAIARALRDVEGLDTVYDYPAGSPTPPCATVGWPSLYTAATYVGGQTAWEATIPVQLLVAMSLDVAADRNLSAFLEPSGSSSVAAVFDADPTLDGLVGSAVVATFTEIGPARFADDGIWYLAATANVEVIAT